MIHLHTYKTIHDTGHTSYQQCACGARRVRQKAGGYQPIDPNWVEHGVLNMNSPQNPPRPTPPFRSPKSIQTLVGEWSERTFNTPDINAILAHFHEEVGELIFARDDENRKEEAADCLLLLYHLAHRLGFDLEHEAMKKQAINVTRNWAEPDERGVMNHV